MRSIQETVLENIHAFLALDERSFFEHDQLFLVNALTQEQNFIDGTRLPNYECFDDNAIISELGRFIDDWKRWTTEVAEIRQQYFWDKLTNELPENYLCVFGFTSPLVMELPEILGRCNRVAKMIGRLLEGKVQQKHQPIPPEHRTKPLTKKQAAKYLGRCGNEKRAVEWLNKCIADGTISWEETSRQSGFYDIRQFDPEKHRLIRP